MPELAFDDLRQIAERLELVLQEEYEFLTGFWNPSRFCFASSDPSLDQVNVTSTCFCLFALLEDRQFMRRFAHDRRMHEDAARKKMANVLLEVDWKSEDLPPFNIYTTPIVITALNRLGVSPNREKILEGLTRILDNVEPRGAASFEDYSPSAYLTYWSARALKGSVSRLLPGGGLRDRCESCLAEISKWSESEVYRQLALYSAGDSASFDVIQLAYALVLYTEGYRGARQLVNEKIVSKAIEVIFSSQSPDGLWPGCRPIYHYRAGGNVYTFSFEMLDSLLSLAREEMFPKMFRPYLKRLEAALNWAEQNDLTAQTGKAQLKGWRSNNLPIPGGPESWSTAAVFSAVRKFESMLKLYLNDDILDEFRATRISHPDRSRFEELYDCEIGLLDGETSLKRLIDKHLVRPHSPNASDVDRVNKRYSAIFFGPPGTAKTALAESIAYALGWPLIDLQTSDFLEEGLDRVAGRARYIFERLGFLQDAVVFFDEVEEFVRDREDATLPLENRLITTSMLTLIQALRRQENVIFIVATNRLKAFDAAITRAGGRFDLILLVPPPSLPEKKRRFKDRLAEIPGIRGKSDILRRFSVFADEHHEESIQFFSFAEWDSLITNVIKDLRSRSAFSEIRLEALLRLREDALTIQGNLRTEYLESQKMSVVH